VLFADVWNSVVCPEVELSADVVTAAAVGDEFAVLLVCGVVNSDANILETVIFSVAFVVLFGGNGDVLFGSNGDDAVVISFGSILLLQNSP
jgi:hypothetical protein